MPEKSIAQKLFIKEETQVLLINAPAGYASKLGKLPKNATVVKESSAPVDFIQVFVANRRELEMQAPRVKKLLKPAGMLWICYLRHIENQDGHQPRYAACSSARVWLGGRVTDFYR